MIDELRTDLDLLWVSKQQQLPDVCSTCGMFTDRRVTTKAVVSVQEPVKEFSILDLVMHLLGPIGWVWLLVSRQDAGGDGTRKLKMKMPQCALCNGQQPISPVQATAEPLQFAFYVHDEFRRRFQELNAEVR